MCYVCPICCKYHCVKRHGIVIVYTCERVCYGNMCGFIPNFSYFSCQFLNGGNQRCEEPIRDADEKEQLETCFFREHCSTSCSEVAPVSANVDISLPHCQWSGCGDTRGQVGLFAQVEPITKNKWTRLFLAYFSFSFSSPVWHGVQ